MEKQFAVIYFPTENIYSEVPSTWLSPDKKHCWWPNSTINARTLMVRCELPDQQTWNLHEVKLEAYASTLESARKKAENPDYLTGGEDLVTDKRSRKPKVCTSSSSDIDITPPPSPTSRKKNKAPKKTIERLINSAKENETFKVLASYDSGNKNDTEVEIQQNAICSCECKGNDTIKDLLTAVEKLSIIASNTQKYVLSIDNRLKAITSEQGKVVLNEVMATISNYLPLKSVEEITKFDTTLSQNDETNRAYIHYITNIGGKDQRDQINRCLPKIFTNSLGRECSYIGLRGNFKLQNFNFIRTFVDVIMTRHSSSLHEIEKSIGEWFRLSNQREKRIEKQK